MSIEIAEKRKFSWDGYETKQFLLQKHAVTLKALGDSITSQYGDKYAASNGIVLAMHGKSNDPLFVAYAEASNAIHVLCKELIDKDNFDWTFVTAEYQTIAFPHSMDMWKKNIEKAMEDSKDIILQK